jgi:hypothetical protein
MGTLLRSVWQNSPGPADQGTPIGNEELQKIYNNVEAEVRSAYFTTITTKSIIDNLMARLPFFFGGAQDTFEDTTSYVTGATLDKLAPNTRPWNVDPNWVAVGTYELEAIMMTSDVAQAAKVSMVNLTDSADVAMFTMQSTSLTGERVRSGPITFPAGGAFKDFGLKLYSAGGGARAWMWGAQLIRTA